MNITRENLRAPIVVIMLCLCSMLAHGSSTANQAFMDALERGDLDTAAKMVDRGVDLDAHRSDGKTLLILAAKESDVLLVRDLVAAGADVNATTENGGTALMFAAIRGDIETQRTLLDAGADVNAVGGFDWTALMVASVKGHVPAVRQLLAGGADPNLGDIYDWTPLMRAVYEGRDRVVQALLEQADIALNAVNDQGATALHLAAIKGDEELARALLLAGANPAVEDAGGRTPRSAALAAGHEDVANLMQ